MLPSGQPKFRRRKAARPDEIVAAALEIFSEKGFAAARLDDIAALARGLAALAPTLLARSELGGVIKMVVGEARNFPEIARLWHAQVIDPALGALSEAIGAAQARGEVRPGDPRLSAPGLIGA